MKNKLTSIILGLVCSAQIGCAINPLDGPLVTLEATVTNESRQPIEKAIVKGLFRTTRGSGEKVVEALTDTNGHASVTAATPFSAYLYVNKDGYYQSQFERIETTDRDLAELAPRTRSREVTLRKKINPIPLIAKRLKDVQIPLREEWIGYDLEVGDWVEPHGKGKQTDILFRYQNEFLGYDVSDEKLEEIRSIMAKWAEKNNREWTKEMERNTHGDWLGTLEIRFPGKSEGILTVTEANGYVAESELLMPHLAPEAGYQEYLSWSDARNGKVIPRNGDGHFLRVRVKERNGEILEANYAKIQQEIYFDPRGLVTFSYCFNPEVNDRNLEFDTDKNLLKNLDSNERVRLP